MGGIQRMLCILSMNAKHSLVGQGEEHDIITLPFNLVKSENALLSLTKGKVVSTTVISNF